jgi:hypothetical protein
MIHPSAKLKLRDRAENAPTSYRIMFEAFERRFSTANPELLLLPHWQSFVGMATLGGCFSLSICLSHEAPEEMRTELEMIMRKQIENRYPGSEAFWEDCAHYVTDALHRIERGERAKYIFLLPALWVLEHVSDSQAFVGKDELCGEITMLFQDESIGYWKAVQDYSAN